MSGVPDKDRLARLEQRIAAAKKEQEPTRKAETKFSQAQQGWRMIVELVVGILIGTGIGYGLDVLFGTLPWFLVPFTLLGFAAGVNVMLKTAKELQEEHAAPGAGKDKED
jgi:ATP synthase protein I